MQTSITYQWADIGMISLDKQQRLVLPELPDEPGVYQLLFQHLGRRYPYVGEAESIRNRFRDYRSPGKSGSTNGRINTRARNVVTTGGEVSILLAVRIRIQHGGNQLPVDLAMKHTRCLIENAAITEVLASEGRVLNGPGHGDLGGDPLHG